MLHTKHSNHIRGKDIERIFINQEAVFSHYFTEPNLTSRYRSPLRGDGSPGCRFSYYEGKLYFIDNAKYKNRLSFNCIYFVKELFNISYYQACRKILEEVELINENVIISDNDFKSTITFTPSNEQSVYFNKLDLTLEDLKTIHCFRVKDYWSNNKEDLSLKKNRLGNPRNEEVFAYYFKESNNIALYFPERETNKFYKSCNKNDLFGINRKDEFNYDEPLIITKSGKDVLVLLKYLNNVVAVQSETTFSSLFSFFQLFPFVVIWFDNDYTGYTYSIEYAKYLRKNGVLAYVNHHSDYLQKDPSDIYMNNSNNLKSYINYELIRKIKDPENLLGFL